MDASFLLKGILIGFAIAAPVGPIGILCIRKTLQFGRQSGFFSGLGAAVADTLYGVVAAFGLTLVSDFLMKEQFWLRLIGGIFMIYLGSRTFFARLKEERATVSHRTLISDFISTFFLTLTNPLTVLSYVAVFAGLGLVHTNESYWDATELVIGVFIGSTIWWLILSEGVTLFRKKVSEKVMKWINRIAGMIIIAFGLAALASIIF